MITNVTLGGCKQDFQIAFDQHLAVLKAYKNSGIPLFLFGWFIWLAHDNNNRLFWADKYFVDFFNRTREFWENTVLFFMSDHGARYGSVRNAGEIGRLEHDKPFITLTVPERLRTNQVLSNFKENSKVLTTPFDVHATLIDILLLGNETGADFSRQRPFNETQYNRGFSLLRPIPARNCHEAYIAKQFCPCIKEETAVSNQSTSMEYKTCYVGHSLLICYTVSLLVIGTGN